jgi:Zn-dependent protease
MSAGLCQMLLCPHSFVAYSAEARRLWSVVPTKRGSIHLFRFAGIDVYLHWSWFLLALYGIQTRAAEYSSYVWPVLEYLTLFLIVTLHEFGHSLACKQVGGSANQIVLWPFGGVAYVSPPPRPGATLWCIAAGPLVNVALFPILSVLMFLGSSLGWPDSLPDLYHFIVAIWWLDLILLIFNLLPIYPLDGGQILQSLLWFVFGRARSLMIAASLGFIGVAGLILLAVLTQNWWLGVMCALVVVYCWGGLQRARSLSRLAAAPHYQGLACPVCKDAPAVGPFWRCGKCGLGYDVFAQQAVCPNCGTQAGAAPCLNCGTVSPLRAFQCQ